MPNWWNDSKKKRRLYFLFRWKILNHVGLVCKVAVEVLCNICHVLLRKVINSWIIPSNSVKRFCTNQFLSLPRQNVLKSFRKHPKVIVFYLKFLIITMTSLVALLLSWQNFEFLKLHVSKTSLRKAIQIASECRGYRKRWSTQKAIKRWMIGKRRDVTPSFLPSYHESSRIHPLANTSVDKMPEYDRESLRLPIW